MEQVYCGIWEIDKHYFIWCRKFKSSQFKELICIFLNACWTPSIPHTFYNKCSYSHLPSLPSGKTAAFMLPVLERLLYKPKQAPVTRVLVLTPTRELAVQIHQVARQIAQHTNIDITLAAGQFSAKAALAVELPEFCTNPASMFHCHHSVFC